MDDYDCIYRDLLGPLGGPQQVWAQCVFVDLVSDLAVLQAPDTWDLSEQARAYEALTEAAIPLTVVNAPEAETTVWTLSLDGQWTRGTARYVNDDPLLVDQVWLSGMSGSPILSEKGAAVGVVSFSGEGRPPAIGVRLGRSLPGWLMRELKLLPLSRKASHGRGPARRG
jgi:hypothetical protein